MERWQNKVAVVTGASAGIGAACCKYLAERGMIVVGLARRKERIEELRTDLDAASAKRLHALKCDLQQESEIVQAFAEIEKTYGPISVLVNNAGIIRDTYLVKENNSADLQAIVNTNIMAVAYCTREAFQSMKANNIDGHVIIINSVAGHKVPSFGDISGNIYPPTKHAVTAMTEVYRQEFLIHKTKIKITSVSPGAVKTEIFTGPMTKIAEQIPMLKAEDVADAVVYCLQTPPHVQIHELTIKPVGEPF